VRFRTLDQGKGIFDGPAAGALRALAGRFRQVVGAVCGRDQSVAIHYDNAAPRQLDEGSLPEVVESDGHAGPPHAKHQRQKFVGER
jgi:hypothetical protein